MDEEKQVVVEEESKGLTFKDILFIIRKHWIAIVAFIVVCTAGGFIWAKLESPTYQSSGIMMISYESGSNTAANNDYAYSNNLANTVVSFIKTNNVLSQVSEQVNVPAETLSKNLSASHTSGDLLVTVSYTASDKVKAKEIVNKIMEVTVFTANKTVDEGGTAKPVHPKLYDNISIIDEALDGKKVDHTLRNTAIGLGAGVVLAFLFVLLRELFDNTFKSSEEIERTLGIPVLAGIPDYHFDDEKKGGK